MFQHGELEMMREYILLPNLLTALKRDISVIKSSSLKITSPYIKLLEATMDKISIDMLKLRYEMKNRRLRVVDEKWTENGLECILLCRGHTETFRMHWDFVKAELEVRMTKYFLNPTRE